MPEKAARKDRLSGWSKEWRSWMRNLNLDIDYFQHPKVRRLVRLLGKGSEVLPLKLWVFTARYFMKDGRLTDISAQEIEAECQWWGESGRMVEVMQDPECLFIERDGDTFVVHDWEEYQKHLWTNHLRAKTAAAARHRKIELDASGCAPSNATSIPLTSLTSLSPPSGGGGRKKKSAKEIALETLGEPNDQG